MSFNIIRLPVFFVLLCFFSCGKKDTDQPNPDKPAGDKVFIRIKNISDVWYYDCKIDAMHNNKQVSFGEIGQDSASRYISFPKAISNMQLQLYVSANTFLSLYNYSTDKSELTLGYYTVTINMNTQYQDVTWITTRDNP